MSAAWRHTIIIHHPTLHTITYWLYSITFRKQTTTSVAHISLDNHTSLSSLPYQQKGLSRWLGASNDYLDTHHWSGRQWGWLDEFEYGHDYRSLEEKMNDFFFWKCGLESWLDRKKGQSVNQWMMKDRINFTFLQSSQTLGNESVERLQAVGLTRAHAPSFDSHILIQSDQASFLLLAE